MATPDVEEFLRALGVLISEYQTEERGADPGLDRSVAYGNVRYQYWSEGEHANIGIIYETPGGSTNQITVEYRPETRDFALPLVTEQGEVVSADQREILRMVRDHVESIPEKRIERLRDYIDSWVEEGLDRATVFERLNSLIFQDLKGGRVTHPELAQGCRYVVDRLPDAE